MSYSSKLSGLKRTKWDNKTTTQKQNILKNHYETLGYSIPKYLDGKKINDKQLNQALNKITKGYTSRTSSNSYSKYSINTEYNKVVTSFNKKVEGLEVTLKNKGFSDLEVDYIKGKEIFIPQIRGKSFHSDLIDLQKITKQVFKNKKAMVEETKRIKQQLKDLNRRTKNNDFYNDKDNINAFNKLISHSSFNDLDESDIDYLKSHFDSLSSFEKEMFVKSKFNDLRDKYKYLFEEGQDNENQDVTSLYNGLLYGIRNTHRAISGNDLLLSKTGKEY